MGTGMAPEASFRFREGRGRRPETAVKSRLKRPAAQFSKAAQGRGFDLNVEKVLEDWEPHHAIREIIANALDEQALSGSRDIRIHKESQGRWHIRDYGRGLRYEHLTQKENEEKLRSPQLIGRFGVGLKDGLATFDRRKIRVHILSPHGDISLGKAEKHGFEDIITLHAFVAPPSDEGRIGTDIVLSGCKDQDIARAKALFLRFSGERQIERTRYGSILDKKGGSGCIYINGVRVAEEENFLFSYNITSITAAIKKALNRERTNVGRGAYAERVKAILLNCSDKETATELVGDLEEYETGRSHDELKWTDVAVHACKLLNARDRVVFVTPEERGEETYLTDHARRDGYRLVTIPLTVRERIGGEKDVAGNPVRDLTRYMHEYNESFEFRFVPPDQLTARESEVFSQTESILALMGGKPRRVKKIAISETMRVEPGLGTEAVGLWEPDLGRIIVKRSQLRSLAMYSATLLHEAAHAASSAPDLSSEFESQLTKELGDVAVRALR